MPFRITAHCFIKVCVVSIPVLFLHHTAACLNFDEATGLVNLTGKMPSPGVRKLCANCPALYHLTSTPTCLWFTILHRNPTTVLKSQPFTPPFHVCNRSSIVSRPIAGNTWATKHPKKWRNNERNKAPCSVSYIRQTPVALKTCKCLYRDCFTYI
jgi:hypothetical protein